MAHQTRTFRIFVSSTFDDLKAERNALQRDCFPRLRKLCAEYGARFQAIDLRWGVSQEATFDQQTLPICLGEINRCKQVTPRPNFIALLGDRYGWRPLPAEIQEDEFLQILECVDDQEERELIGDWYRQDTNAVPSVWYLKERIGEWQEVARWSELEARLHSILERATRNFNIEARSKFITSATMQEIVAGAIGPPDSSEHVFAFFRRAQKLPDDDTASQYRERDPLLQSQLADLKQDLRTRLSDHVHDYDVTWLGKGHDPPITLDHLDKLCGDVYHALEGVILRELREMEQHDPLDQEIMAHSTFAMEHTRFFVGRSDALNRIAHYLKDDSARTVLAITGQSGSGKSALMAQAVVNAVDLCPTTTLVSRFIGVTPESSSGRELLVNLCQQIGREYGVEESVSALDDLELAQTFRQRLGLATQEKPIILFLDALDQLRADDTTRNLGWLPIELAQHAKLIVSSLPEDSGVTLRARFPDADILELDSMSIEQGEALLDLWLADARRTLSSEQREAVLNSFRSVGLPLYLKLLFEEVRLRRSTDSVPDIPGDIPGMIKQLFERLSDRANHGPILVSRAMGYLAASSTGLSEDEILDLLAADNDVYEDFIAKAQHELPSQTIRQRRIPVVIWSRLRMDLEPYLSQHSVDGATLLTFYHRQLRQMASDSYLKGQDGTRVHRLEAEYFARAWQDGNVHALGELPYQQQAAQSWSDLHATLTNIEFMQAKIAQLSAARLIQDYERAIDEFRQDASSSAAGDPQGLERLRNAIRLSLAVVSDDATQLRSQLVGRLGQSRNSTVEAVITACVASSGTPWLKPLSRNLTAVGTGQQRSIAAHEMAILSMAASANFEQAITASQDKTIKVWRLGSGEEIQRLLGHDDRVDCVAVDGKWSRAVSGSSDGTLKFWDLGSGLEVYSCKLPSAVGDVCMTADGSCAIVSTGNILTVWEFEKFSQLLTLTGHTSPIHGICLTDEDKYIVSVSFDGSLRRWNLDSGEGLVLIEGTESLWHVAATPRANRIVTASTEKILVWDYENGAITHVTGGHDKAIMALAVSDDGRVALSGGVEGDIKIWNLDSGTELKVLRGHTNAVSGLSVAEDGEHVVSASSDGSIRTWDLAAASDERMVHNGELRAVAVSSELGKGISASRDEKVDPAHILDRVSTSPPAEHVLKVWDLESGEFIQDLEGHETHPARGSGVCEVVVAHDGQWLVSGGADGSVRIWKLESGQLLHILGGSIGSVDLIRTSAEGHRVVAEDGHDLLVWNLVSGTGFRISPAHSETVSAIAVTQDGGRAVSASYDRLLKVWDLEERRELFTLRGHEDSIRSVAITQDGQHAVSGSWDKTVRIWDLVEGRELFTLVGHTHWVNSVAINPEGIIAASAAHDNTVRLWNPLTGEALAVLEGHRGAVNKVRLTNDGQIVWSISEDHTLKVWSSATGVCIATYTAEGPLEQIAVTSDGIAVVAEGNTSGLVHILKLEGV